jgi:hypothetical protein
MATRVIVYGRDLSCVDDLEDSMLEVDGWRALGEALARRLITPRGGLLDDENYGFDVTDYLNDDLIGAGDIAKIAAGIDAEFAKDERILRSKTTITYLAGVITAASSITTLEGPFALVLGISDVTVSILRAVA